MEIYEKMEYSFEKTGGRCLTSRNTASDVKHEFRRQNQGMHRCAMTMNYKTYGDINSPALLLVFGFSMSIEDWVDFGYVDRLKDTFYLIAVEPFGHGRSDSSDDPGDYSLGGMAVAVKRIMDALQVKQAVLWGYSLGAKILLHFAGTFPEKACGLVLGGFELHSEVNLSDDLVFNTLGAGNQKWLALWQTMFPVPPAMEERFLAVNTQRLQALRRAEAAWPDLRFAPGKLQVKSILYAGEYCFYRQQTKEAAGLFSDSVFMELPGYNHFELMAAPDRICKRVIDTFSTSDI